VVHSRDDEGLGAEHEVNSPKKILNDDGAALVR